MKKLLLLLCMVMEIIYLHANTNIFKNIGLQQGLSNGFVNDMVIDNQGFLWAATESGINRIAGNKCTVFKTNNSKISSDVYINLYYDKGTNCVWMLSKEGKIDIFNCKTQQFEQFSSRKGMINNSVAAINGSCTGGIWIAYYNGYIQHYNPKNQGFTTISNKRFPKNKSGVRYIADDGKDHLYIGLRMEGLYIYNLRTQKSKYFTHNPKDAQSLPGNNVRTICIDHLQNVWIGTNQGLARFDSSTGKFRVFKHQTNNPHSLAGDNIHQIIEMKDHTLWIASDLGGISVLDLNRFRRTDIEELFFRQIVKDNSGLSSNSTRRIIEDTFGNIWIGNFNTGVDFIPNHEAEFHTLSYLGLPISNINGIYYDKAQNCLWLGQDNSICQYRDGKIVQELHFTPYLSNSSASVFYLEKDHLGNLWFGTNDNGILKYNPSTHQFDHLALLQNLDVHALHEDKQGKMWIGSEKGIYSVENGLEKEEREINRMIGEKSNAIIYTIAEDNYGQLWIGTFSSGVFVLNKNRKLIVHLNDHNHLRSNTINHIVKDEDGGIWIGTTKGLAYVTNPLKPQAVKIYDERQGIKDSHIRAICQDKQGNIWVSMFAGIACLDIHKQHFYNYDYQNGIPTGNFVEASATITPDGTIYFGSPGGVCYFTPQLLNEQSTVSPVQIIYCERIGKLSKQFISRLISLDKEGVIRVEYDDNTFKITFTTQDLAQEGNVEYSYMMKGLDDQWYETEGDNEVTFRNLKPGDYTFIIRAKLKNQDWEDASTAEMKVVVNPPLWLTWWAKLCYVLLIMGILGYFFRSYQKQLLLRNSLVQEKWESKQRQQVNEERLRFFTNITHELRTPLTLILGPLEDLMEDKEIAERVHHKIGCIHASAERLLNLINDILEFRKTQTQNRKLTVAKANLGALVREIGVRFKDLNQNSRLNIRLNIKTGVPELYFDSEVINTVINNLMSNAIKYTPEGSITLSLTMPEDNTVAIAVEDTGYGIDKDALPHICDRYYQENGNHQASGTGIGLALVKSLATLHQAELTVESEKGRGSKFTFSLKADRTYPEALHKDDNQDLATAENAEENETTSKEPTEDIRPLLLIVEDNADIRLYIEESLHEDYRIIQACNGREGMEQAFSKVPDIIVSDIMMPEMDGIKMTHILKEDIRTSHIPIILLTAKTSINDQEEGYDSGADSYLTKPFSAKLLHSRIRNILSGRRRLADYIVQKNISQFETSADEQQTSQKATEEKEDAMTCQISNLDKKFLEKLNKLIENHISTDDLDMAFMTDKMAMSHSTFYRKVKALTGMSANEYIKKAKLRHSMTLLKKGEYSIAEVAILAGFNNLGNFRESFKREFGKSPSEILKGK